MNFPVIISNKKLLETYISSKPSNKIKDKTDLICYDIEKEMINERKKEDSDL